MERRNLAFSTLDDLLADIHALPAEGLSASGNWTPAGNVEHVAKVIHFSAEGFPDGKPPFMLKLIFSTMVKVMGKRIFAKPLQPGKIKFPPSMAWLEPEDGVTWPQAVQRLEDAVASAKQHGMPHPSPIAGKLSEEQWLMLHCRHAELHFSFIQPAAEASEAYRP